MKNIATRLGRLWVWTAKAAPILFAVLLLGVALPDTFGPEPEDKSPSR